MAAECATSAQRCRRVMELVLQEVDGSSLTRARCRYGAGVHVMRSPDLPGTIRRNKFDPCCDELNHAIADVARLAGQTNRCQQWASSRGDISLRHLDCYFPKPRA
jgi:hypothetical protein